MEGAFGRQRRFRRPTINITPLIDVMFLLLIFFMLTTTFREHLGIDVSLPQAATAESMEITKHEVTVKATGEIYFGGNRVDLPGLRTALETVLQEEPRTPIVLRADKDAAFQDVIRVIDMCRAVGGLQLIIPTHLPSEEWQ